MSIAALKKATSSNFDTLNQKINSLMNPSRQDNDERFWQPVVDKAGNGYAVIRFLPSPDLDSDGNPEIPFARVWDHGFKGPGGWYIENSLTTIEKSDPVTDYNNILWNSGNKADRDFVSGTPGNSGSKRRLHFYSNILVVEDPANPKNNGKVFLYRYGKKIYDKLNNAMNPKIPNLPKINPFDMWNGANFLLQIEKVDGQRNYNESRFDAASPVANGDAEIDAIWKQTRSLKEFTDPTKFKSYEVLKAKLDRVLGQGKPRAQTVEQDEAVPQSFAKVPTPKVNETTPPWENTEAEEEKFDELAEFKQFLNDS